MNQGKHLIVKSPVAIVTFILFAVFAVWWWLLSPFEATSPFPQSRTIWSVTYQLVALWGGINGLIISMKWGGFRSLVGRAVLALSFGLLLQVFGQAVYSYYLLKLGIDAPYPSLGDVGFFGSVLAYIFGAFLFIKASGANVSMRANHNLLLGLILPFIILFLSYYIFLQDYVFDWSNPLQVFLDFGYPLGQALYVSLAAVALLMSRKTLGGLMRIPILALLLALIVQYLADFNFLYQFSHDSFYAGGYGDFIYLLAYFLMAGGLIRLDLAFKQARES
jgi:hypothetical protein